MAGLEDLYREIILDHYRSPRNRGELPVPPAVMAEGHNPLCGDEITIYVDVDTNGADGDGVVRDLKVAGQGCSISQSSASMMSQAVIGKTLPEVRSIVRRFKGMMTIDDSGGDDSGGDDSGGDGSDVGAGDDTGDGAEAPGASADDPHPLGDLEALQGVVKFPVRIKCATLGWNTLLQALDEHDDPPASS